MADGFITRKGGGVNVNDATATTNDVLQGETFYSGDKDIKTGNIPSKGVETFTPSTSNQTISSGQYLSGTQTILGDPDLVPENIKDGTTIFNVTGTLEAAPETGDYIQATGGSIYTYENNGTFYKSHTFYSSGTFSVQSLSTVAARNQVDYLIIAGGGGGGGNQAGGGGAGGYRTTNGTSGGNSTAESKITLSQTNYTITIGAGGSGGTSASAPSGSISSALGITSTGGGGGGNSGGSGGGGAYGRSAGSGTSGQGTNGGSGGGDGATWIAGGGGGGAGGAGQAWPNRDYAQLYGRGGPGLSNSLRLGIAETRAGGGGGAAGEIYGGGGAGGSASHSYVPAVFGSGSGGAGAINSGSNTGSNGGSGIVIIRYEVGGL